MVTVLKTKTTQLFAFTTEKNCFERKENACNENSARQFAYKSGHLINFFQKQSVLIESQCGFQNNMSTTHAILDVLNTSYDQINDNNFTCVILLDFQKGFNTVYRTSLLGKLEYYGIRGVAQKLMSSFLLARQQYFAHQDMQFEIVTNRFGVLQGRNLGSL